MNCEKLIKKKMKPMLDMAVPVLLSRRKNINFIYKQYFMHSNLKRCVFFLHRKAFNILQENPIRYDVNWFVVKWFNAFIKISVFFCVIVINDFDYKNNTIKNDAKMA